MSYTKEQLRGMSDLEIEMALAKSLDLRNVHERGGMACYQMQFGGSKAVQYCTDWSATGPLLVERGVALSPAGCDNKWCAELPGGEIDMFSSNPSPLRAVCEVILMMEKA